tara:strand:- start:20 stop:313 length:294 start_codon:yes stop_codon:yes gene_type:complete
MSYNNTGKVEKANNEKQEPCWKILWHNASGYDRNIMFIPEMATEDDLVGFKETYQDKGFSVMEKSLPRGTIVLIVKSYYNEGWDKGGKVVTSCSYTE